MMNDQANRLRELTRTNLDRESKTIAEKVRTMDSKKIEETPVKNTRIYSVVSGKGGVGKTNFSINLAIKLQQLGKKVLILDGDIGMSNANILLGISALLNLAHVIKGDKDFKDIVIEGPAGIGLVCGGVDLFLIESLERSEQEGIIKSLEELGDYDIIIIDNGAGINKHSLTFSSFADEVILVTTPEPTALTDAYRILKANCLYNIAGKVNVVINQVVDKEQGEASYRKLEATCQKFLDIELESLGFIFNDIRVNKAIMEQEPLLIKYPKALASENIEKIAGKILGLDPVVEEVNSFKRLSNRLIKFFG